MIARARNLARSRPHKIAGTQQKCSGSQLVMQGGEKELSLRQLNAEEAAWLERNLEDAYFDVFARLFPAEEDRLRGARFSGTSSDAS